MKLSKKLLIGLVCGTTLLICGKQLSKIWDLIPVERIIYKTEDDWFGKTDHYAYVKKWVFDCSSKLTWWFSE